MLKNSIGGLKMFKVNVSSHTDIGDVKKTNQDSILHLNDTINGHNVGLFIVADGCGGLEYGEEISNLIITHFSRLWNDELRDLISTKKVDIKNIDLFLNKALNEINDKAIGFSKMVSGKVGSTLTMLFTVDDQYIIKNVGDSRVYLKRGRKISQLTEDQSLVADMIRNGELTKEEAKSFKKKNVLTMCIGVFEDLKIYSKFGKIKNNDTFILCCDGLHNHVSAECMLKILNNKKVQFDDKAYEMRNAIEHGKANDNVSSIICEFYKKKKISMSSVAILIIALALLSYIFRDIICDFIMSNLMMHTEVRYR